MVKEVDSKSTGLCPREFKSRRCRLLHFFLFNPFLLQQQLRTGVAMDRLCAFGFPSGGVYATPCPSG